MQDLSGGLNTSETTREWKKKTQFKKMKNVFYNDNQAIQVRNWFEKFGNEIDSNPITSLFYWQNDQTMDRHLMAVSGNDMYEFNEGTDSWDSIFSDLIQFEQDGVTPTKWDWVVFKNVVYMCDGVNPYMNWDGTTVTQQIGSPITVTFDGSTDVITQAGHTFVENDSVLFRGGTLPTGLFENRVYYVVPVIGANDYQISETPSWTPIDFTGNGTPTTDSFKLSEPRVRYLEFLQDRIFSGGEDLNPSTLYFTDAAPVNGNNIDQNAVVIGGDELGRIRGIKELGQIVLVGKDSKIYSVDVSVPSALPIDSREGLRSNRSIQNVENSLLYFNESGVHNLIQRTGVVGRQALSASALSDDIRELFDDIRPIRFQDNASLYANELNNFYFSFDNTDSARPNETIVYSSLTQSWTRYTYPNLFDYTIFRDENEDEHFLICSANGGQVYEIETGFEDDWLAIQAEVEFEEDFDEQGLKDWRWFEIYWFKSQGVDINVTIELDGTNVGWGVIDDTMITSLTSFATIGTSAIWSLPIGGEEVGEWLDVFPFKIRIPLEATWSLINVNIASNDKPTVWILEKLRVDVDEEILDLFETANYA